MKKTAMFVMLEKYPVLNSIMNEDDLQELMAIEKLNLCEAFDDGWNRGIESHENYQESHPGYIAHDYGNVYFKNTFQNMPLTSGS